MAFSAGSISHEQLDLRRNLKGPIAKAPLGVGLAIYIVLVAFLSYCQRGRINADFIGYVTVAHRLLVRPGSSISGHWSPLFSWCLAALIKVGVPDLIAGRAILVGWGIVYVIAVCRVASRFQGGEAGSDLFLMMGALTCAVVQALCWSIYLLDPDLIAAALFFVYADVVLDPELPGKPGRAFAGGLMGGLAYLSKAYMFPFIAVHLPVTLFMRYRLRRPGKTVTTMGIFFFGMAIFVAPWAAVLSSHLHRFTFSTAGSSNHANLSLANEGYDRLFNPGLVADYVVDPHLEPDWSPFQDWASFRHQMALVGKNLNVILGHFGPWFAMAALGVGLRAVRRRRKEEPRLLPAEAFGIAWCLMSFVLYCAGYTPLVVEARYVVSTGAPLLFIAAVLLARSPEQAQNAARGGFDRWMASASGPVIVLITLFFSSQQIQRLAYSALFHTQTRSVAQLRPIAGAMEKVVPANQTMACNHWHDGLAVAYLCDRIPSYLGTPATMDFSGELNAAHAKVYLRLIEPETPSAPIVFPDVFVPGDGWTLAATVKDSVMGTWTAEIYCRNPVETRIRIESRR